MRTQRAGSLTQGLVGAWCPSLGATGFRLLNRSQYRNDVTLTSMASTAWVASGGKLALSFDNTNDSANCVHINAIDSGFFSVSFWYNPVSVVGANQMFGQWSGSAGLIAFRSGAAIAWQVGGESNRATSANVLSVGTWCHIVCIRDSVLRVAFNGRMEAATATPGTQNNTEPFVIAGAITGAGTGNGNCMIDDFRIYNRALTAPEIRQLYVGGRGFGLIPERPRRRGTAAAAAFNRRRRVLLTAG